MELFKRFPENPIIAPNPEHDWEAFTYNPSVATDGQNFHLVYRALSKEREHNKVKMRVSVVGYAHGADPFHFGSRRELIVPEHPWEAFGCEDPRITFFEGKYYIFYTALSSYPFGPDSIKVGVAVTQDFEHFEKHPVTTFNAKAMTLLPERVNGKIAAILTVDTDRPPAKIGLALFDNESDIWSDRYWEAWYGTLNTHVIPLLRNTRDQVEIGAVPIPTPDGWLFLYSYIANYRSGRPTFGVEAALLDRSNPQLVLGRSHGSLLSPEKDYERVGLAHNVVFPSGALLAKDKVLLYYGGADTVCCVAGIELAALLNDLRPAPQHSAPEHTQKHELVRFSGNPILEPRAEFSWEAKAVFNPAAIYENGRIHIVYRAMSEDNTSVFGYASSHDGVHIDERLPDPIYTPREPFEEKRVPGGNSGCEDPRITRVGDVLYMYYTAYNSTEPPRVAVTSIKLDDFLAHRWNWERPAVISIPNYDDKDACLLPKKFGDKYVIFHRIGANICVDAVPDFRFTENHWLEGMTLFGPREDKWDNVKIGIAAPPIETKDGWLLFYHGVSQPGNIYKLGAALLDLQNPLEVIARSEYPLLTPEMKYEREGQVPNVVFPCGAVVVAGTVFVYYGGADSVVGVATADLEGLLETLKGNK